MDHKELMKRLNGNSQFLQSNDMKVTQISEGSARVEMLVDAQILNVHGFVHGGALYSLADTAAGAASFATGRDSVTLTGTINYIKPGRGGKLIGVATEISRGRTTGCMRYLSIMMSKCCYREQPLPCFFLTEIVIEIIHKKESYTRNVIAFFLFSIFTSC